MAHLELFVKQWMKLPKQRPQKMWNVDPSVHSLPSDRLAIIVAKTRHPDSAL